MAALLVAITRGCHAGRAGGADPAACPPATLETRRAGPASPASRAQGSAFPAREWPGRGLPCTPIRVQRPPAVVEPHLGGAVAGQGLADAVAVLPRLVHAPPLARQVEVARGLGTCRPVRRRRDRGGPRSPGGSRCSNRRRSRSTGSRERSVGR